MYVQYSNHLFAGDNNYALSGYKNEMNVNDIVRRVIFRWIVFPYEVSALVRYGCCNLRLRHHYVI